MRQAASFSPFVESKRNLWELDGLAQRYGQRPSSFLGLPADCWEAYQLDLATWTVGRWIESKLSERDKKGKPKHALADLLRDEKAQPQPQYAPVSLLLGGKAPRKVHIKEDGTWDD